MIAGLVSLADERQLLVPADLDGATVAVCAEALAPLDSAEITARLAALGSRLHLVVVFDGPLRTAPARLSDGLARRRVLKAVLEAHVPVLSAPGLAAAQIAYMHQEHFVTHAADCDEVFLFGDVPLVVNLFAPGGEAEPHVLHRRALLSSLQVSEPLFLEAAIGAGSAVHEPFLLVQDSGIANLESAVAAAVYSGEGSFVKAATRLAPHLQLELLQTLSFVVRHPVLLTNGTVALGNRYNQPLPRDIVDIVGLQLPAELFWCHNKGLLGPELPEAAARSRFTDYFSSHAATRALDSDSIAQLQTVEEALRPVRQQAYSLLTQRLHRYFQNRPVVNASAGGADFARATPRLPEIAAEDARDAVKVARVVARFVRSLVDPEAKFASVSDLELPEHFVRARVPAGPLESVAISKAQLAMREYAEVAVCNLLSRGLVPRSIDTRALVIAMPW